MKRAVVAAVLLFTACCVLTVCFLSLRIPQPEPVGLTADGASPADVHAVVDLRSPLELLRTPVKLDFDGVPLADALAQLGAQIQAPIELDAVALEAAGISPQQRIDLIPAERTAHEWLRRILFIAGSGETLRTTIGVDGDHRYRLLITTTEEVERRYLWAVPHPLPAAMPPLTTPSISPLLNKRITLAKDRIDLHRAVELVGEQIGIPCILDSGAFHAAGVTANQSFGISVHDRPASEVLAQIANKVSPQGRVRFVFRGPQDNPTTMVLTTNTGDAETRGWAVRSGITTNSQSTMQQWREDSKRPPNELRTAQDAVVYLAGRLEAIPYVDSISVWRTHRIELTHRIRFPQEYQPAEEALAAVLRQVDGELDYYLDVDELGRKALVISTHGTIASLGTTPTYAALRKKNYFGGLELLQVRDLNWQALTAALGKPVTGAEQELPLKTALQRTAAAVGVPLEVLDADLVNEEISPTAPVHYDPKGREARAVLWDLLRQADPQKNHRAIYCYQRGDDDRMQLLVTTRAAAEAAGRSIPFDFHILTEKDE